MADLSQSLIQIKRSKYVEAPQHLRPGELAFSSGEKNAGGLGVLYIGGATPAENSVYAQTIHAIGGTKYTDLLDVTAGKVVAGKAVIADADGKIDQLAVGVVTGVKGSDGNTTLTIGSEGASTVIHNPYVVTDEGNVPLNDFVTTLVESGVELVAGNGIDTITKNADGAFQIGLKKLHDFSGKEGNVETVGSSTAIPVITINEFGQITAASSVAISTKLAVDGHEVDLVSGKIVAADGVKSTQSATGEVTISADDTVIRTTGGQTIAGTLNVTGQADFGVAPKVGSTETVLTDATVAQALVYQSSDKSTVAVGGYPVGTVFDTPVSVLDLIDGMLHPYVPIKDGSLTITKYLNGSSSATNATVFESGDVVTVKTVKAIWKDGSKKVTSVTISRDGVEAGSAVPTDKKEVGTANSVTITLATPAEYTYKSKSNFTSVITDGQTPLKPTSPGLTFVDPFWYGVVDAGVTSLTSDDVKALVKITETKGTKTLKYTTSNQRAVIAYPTSYGSLKSATDPNNFENIAAFTRTETSVVCKSGDTVPYYVYISGAFTGTDFKYVFSF